MQIQVDDDDEVDVDSYCCQYCIENSFWAYGFSDLKIMFVVFKYICFHIRASLRQFSVPENYVPRCEANLTLTLPQFNIAPEKLPCQWESSLPITTFEGLC